jgi:pseudouridine-5'-phosphate glycosidase
VIGGNSGLMIANPIPAPDAIDGKSIEAAIERALADARARGISQKEVTPYLLSRVVDITGGQSLKANVKLISHNAKVAAQIAVAYEDIMRSKN